MTADNTIAELVERCKEAIQPLIPAIQQLTVVLKERWNDLYSIPGLSEMIRYQPLEQEYPKVYNLAFNHPKKRVRKKNMNRLKKYWRKQYGIDQIRH